MLLADVGGSYADAANNIEMGLAQAAAAGNGELHVELAAVSKFYSQLYETYQSLLKVRQQLGPELVDAHGDTAAVTTQVAGVNKAWQTTAAAGAQPGQSLEANLTGLSGLMVQFLQNVYDSYMSYLKADEAGSQELTDAGRGA